MTSGRYRVFEILPGVLTWTTLIAPFFMSLRYPAAVALFVLIYDLYWLFRSGQLTVNMLRAYRRMKEWAAIDWAKKLKGRDFSLARPNGRPTVATVLGPNDLIHVVILIFYKESYELLERSIASYVEARTPRRKLWLLLAAEERAGSHGQEVAARVEQNFSSDFGRIILTLHPANIPGEIKSKSSNATYAAKKLKAELDRERRAPERVIIHNFDADTRVRPDYFNAVEATYLESELGVPTSFQPIHIYVNNIWDTPALMRIIAQSASIIFMNNTMRPLRFHHFSSRSDVLSTIVAIGYWTVDAIPEDSRQYFDSFFAFGERMRIEPIFIPLRMDAVLAEGYWRTVQNQYRQLRRWAWGIVDLAYVVRRSVSDHRIPWRLKLAKILLLLESHYSWATAAILITFIGWIPLLLHPNFSATVLGYNFPNFTRIILTTALIGLFATVIISILLLPERPPYRHRLSYLGFVFQWFLSPVASIFLSSFAAIDAQTRLLLGRYLEYQVTEKKVAQHR